jgi:hypothetical protein
MLKNALLVTASIIVGAGGVQLLHAAAGTPVYAIAAIDVTNTEGYTKEFLPKTQPAIKEAGGEYLAGGMNKTTMFDGMNHHPG